MTPKFIFCTNHFPKRSGTFSDHSSRHRSHHCPCAHSTAPPRARCRDLDAPAQPGVRWRSMSGPARWRGSKGKGVVNAVAASTLLQRGLAPCDLWQQPPPSPSLQTTLRKEKEFLLRMISKKGFSYFRFEVKLIGLVDSVVT